MSYFKGVPSELYFRLTVDGDSGGAAGIGQTGITVEISKAGGSFATPAGTVSEVGRGWYKVGANVGNFDFSGKGLLFASKSSYRANVQFDVQAFAEPVANYFEYAAGQDKRIFFRLTAPDGTPVDLATTDVAWEYEIDGGGFKDSSTLASSPLTYNVSMGSGRPDRGWYLIKTNAPEASVFGTSGGGIKRVIINAWSTLAGTPAKGTTILNIP